MHLHSNNRNNPETAGFKKYTKLIKQSCGLDVVTSLSPVINVSKHIAARTRAKSIGH